MVVNRPGSSRSEKPQDVGVAQDTFNAAPHLRLDELSGGVPAAVKREMALSYAAVVKKIGNQEFSKRPTSNAAKPLKGPTKMVGENVKSRRQPKPSTRRSSSQQKQQEFIHLVDTTYSDPLNDLSEGDLAVAAAEAEHMANFAKIMTRQEALADDREEP